MQRLIRDKSNALICTHTVCALCTVQVVTRCSEHRPLMLLRMKHRRNYLALVSLVFTVKSSLQRLARDLHIMIPEPNGRWDGHKTKCINEVNAGPADITHIHTQFMACNLYARHFRATAKQQRSVGRSVGPSKSKQREREKEIAELIIIIETKNKMLQKCAQRKWSE